MLCRVSFFFVPFFLCCPLLFRAISYRSHSFVHIFILSHSIAHSFLTIQYTHSIYQGSASTSHMAKYSLFYSNFCWCCSLLFVELLLIIIVIHLLCKCMCYVECQRKMKTFIHGILYFQYVHLALIQPTTKKMIKKGSIDAHQRLSYPQNIYT